MVKLKIDNKTVEVAKGTTLREAAVSVGIDIPVLCFFDQCKATGSCMVFLHFLHISSISRIQP